jgi:NAD+ kinase
VATVAVVPHVRRPQATDLAREAVEWLLSNGHKVRVPGEDAALVEPLAEHAWPTDQIADGLDLALSLGGDGTMLRAVDMLAGCDVPVLGVHVGHLGYLTEVEPAGLRAALVRFFAGDYEVEPRMTLQVERAGREEEGEGAESAAAGEESGVPGPVAPAGSTVPPPGRDGADGADAQAHGVPVTPTRALNEAVVEKTVSGHTIRLSAAVNGEMFTTYAADGLIVATPTGSTAYSLSARGPIVSPRQRAIVLTPVSPHMLFDRSLVLGPDEWVELTVLEGPPAALVIDGRSHGMLQPGQGIVCRAGAHDALFVTFGPRNFHQILKAKFGLADR